MVIYIVTSAYRGLHNGICSAHMDREVADVMVKDMIEKDGGGNTDYWWESCELNPVALDKNSSSTHIKETK